MLTKADLVAALDNAGAVMLYDLTSGDVSEIVDVILREIIAKTASPRTCEEITRVLEGRE